MQAAGYNLIYLNDVCSNERQQLVEERDVAVEQLRYMEVSRDDLARQQGQYKGRIAKVASRTCCLLISLLCTPHIYQQLHVNVDLCLCSWRVQ